MDEITKLIFSIFLVVGTILLTLNEDKFRKIGFLLATLSCAVLVNSQSNSISLVILTVALIALIKHGKGPIASEIKIRSYAAKTFLSLALLFPLLISYKNLFPIGQKKFEITENELALLFVIILLSIRKMAQGASESDRV